MLNCAFAHISVGWYARGIKLKAVFVNEIERIEWSLENNVWLTIPSVRYCRSKLYRYCSFRYNSVFWTSKVHLHERGGAKPIWIDMNMALRWFLTEPVPIKLWFLFKNMIRYFLPVYLINKAIYSESFSIWFDVLICYVFRDLRILCKISISSYCTYESDSKIINSDLVRDSDLICWLIVVQHEHDVPPNEQWVVVRVILVLVVILSKLSCFLRLLTPGIIVSECP